MSLNREQLKRMAELLRVDELVEYGVLRPAYGFALRVGQLVEKVEIDEPILAARNPAAALDAFVRELFAVAQKLRARAEQAERRAALRAFVGSAQPVAPAEIQFIPLSTPTSKVLEEWLDYKEQAVCSALGMSQDQLGIADDKSKPLDRFAAVAQELESL